MGDWMAGLVFVGGCVALTLYLSWKEKQKQALLKAIYQQKILEIIDRVQTQFDRIDNLKTNSSKVTACGKALGMLKEAGEIEGVREVVTNYDELLSRLYSLKKVLPVMTYVERAEKHRFKGKDKLELNALQDAIYEIKSIGVTEDDFARAEAYPPSGEVITIESLNERCRNLGWEPK